MTEQRAGPKDLTSDEQNTIAQWLLERSCEGKLQWGMKKVAAEKFNVCLKTIWKIWSRAAAQQGQGIPINIKSKKFGSVHKKTKPFDEEKIKSLSVLHRTSFRVMAEHLHVSKSQCHLWYKNEMMEAHTNAVKPFLTPQNMLCRLNWSISQLGNIIHGGKIKFQQMQNTVHIDEKWFYLTKARDRYYLAKGEKKPHRMLQSKSHILKIMFSCALARPIIDTDGKVIFDGKLGIFPFITEEPAQRNSKNRAKGTMELKPLQAVTREVSKKQLLTELVPAIKANWPDCLSKEIYIQQDNAKPHIKDSDPDFQAIAHSDGFHIHLINQPANSPDTNINDLGFFRSIQSLKDKKHASTVKELMENVMEAYENYPPWKINKIFLQLQMCYEEIMKVKGSNEYTLPHMGKDSMIKEGILPDCIEVELQLVRESLAHLNLFGMGEDKFYNLDALTEALELVGLEE